MRARPTQKPIELPFTDAWATVAEHEATNPAAYWRVTGPTDRKNEQERPLYKVELFEKVSNA